MESDNVKRSQILGCICDWPFTVAAFHGDSLIGAVTVRLEQQQDGTAKLCFITLGVLAAYRGCGIGTSYKMTMILVSSRRDLYIAVAAFLQQGVVAQVWHCAIVWTDKANAHRFDACLACLPACLHTPGCKQGIPVLLDCCHLPH